MGQFAGCGVIQETRILVEKQVSRIDCVPEQSPLLGGREFRRAPVDVGEVIVMGQAVLRVDHPQAAREIGVPTPADGRAHSFQLAHE